MPSVAARILKALHARLLDIRGQGDMVNDLQGRVHLHRFGYDLDAEAAPAVFIARRAGGGTDLVQRPGANLLLHDVTTVYDVVGVVAQGNACSLDGEHLLADIIRALERPDDVFLRCDALGKNLLSQELRLVDVQFAELPAGAAFDLVGVGVQCTHPHKYGDPDHVE